MRSMSALPERHHEEVRPIVSHPFLVLFVLSPSHSYNLRVADYSL